MGLSESFSRLKNENEKALMLIKLADRKNL